MTKRICVVGGGRWGRNHIQTLASMGHLAGVVETNPETLAGFQRQYPGIAGFARVQDAVQHGFDGFTVATPAQTHFEIARFLLEHDNPVLVEKPLTLRSAEARELARLARQRRICLMVGHVMLFHPVIRRIKEMIVQGSIGRLQYVYSNRLNLGTVRTEENILWSFAPHDISIFHYFIGADPTEVVSRGAAFVQPTIHDTTMTTLRYPGNIVGHIFVSWLHPFKEHRLVVIGTKGMLSYEDSSPQKELLIYEKGIDWIDGAPVPREGATDRISFGDVRPLTDELRYFVDNLENPDPEVAGAESGVKVLEVLELATASLEMDLGRPADVAGCAVTRGGAQQPAVDAPAANGDYFVHPSSFVDQGVTIGAGTKIWHFSHIQSGSLIGANCSIGQNVNVGNNVRIGNHVKIQNNVSVYEGVELEDYVFCGPSMVFTNVRDPRCKYPQRGSDKYLRTLVREGASLGANCTIVCGNTIGRHAFVGAGAVVTRDVPDYALVAGVPAKQIGWVSEHGEKLPPFDRNGRSVCPRSGKAYVLADGVVRAESECQPAHSN